VRAEGETLANLCDGALCRAALSEVNTRENLPAGVDAPRTANAKVGEHAATQEKSMLARASLYSPTISREALMAYAV
jgi:hypothetical protein